MGLNEVNRTKLPYIYRCHMGLTEVIIPILQNDEIIGYLMFGQIAETKKQYDIKQRIFSATSDPDFRARLCDILNETETYPQEKIHNCINILKIMIDYMNLSYVIQKNDETIFYRVKKYILDHLSQPILQKDICQNIGISSGTLYKTVQKNTGQNPTSFIRTVKLEHAKRLLKTTSLSVSQIAEAIGFPDVNYFIRIFRQEVGVPPLRYRKTEMQPLDKL